MCYDYFIILVKIIFYMTSFTENFVARLRYPANQPMFNQIIIKI